MCYCVIDMRKAHHSAQKHLENIISQREKVTVLLEAQKQEIEIRSTALVEGEVPNVAELGKIHKEKLMVLALFFVFCFVWFLSEYYHNLS